MRINPEKPNIILINCDDLGYGDIGCYGSTANKTPAIDRLATEGMLFTDFYAAAPVCTPSRAAMLTGSYPKRINMHSFGVRMLDESRRIIHTRGVLFPGQAEGLHPEEKTIATVLKDSGYVTKIIGKWHVGDQPEFLPGNFGFDSWFGIPYSNDMGLQTRTAGNTLREMGKVPLPLMRDNTVVQEQPDQAGITERYTEEAVSFIRSNDDRPFFLYLAHTYVHNPLFVPETFMNRSANGVLGAAIAEIDWSLEMLQYELERSGLTDNTLVIFASDNGGAKKSSNAPLRGFKGSTWEGGQRVNCVMKWPAYIPAGITCNEICSMMDFFPTFAEIGGVDTDDDLVRDGHSMLELMKGETGIPSQYETFLYFNRGRLEAIRRGEYKLHLERRELYDLKKDVGETDNRYNELPEIVAELDRAADVSREDLGDDVTGITGANVRPCGRVEDPKPLAAYDLDHPYIVALYDTACE
jgi:arylsulfatase A